MARPLWRRVARTALEALAAEDELATPQPQEADQFDPQVLTMLRALGSVMMRAGRATNDVGETLTMIAAKYTSYPVKIVVLPTVIILQVAHGEHSSFEMESTATRLLRLDQVGAVDQLIDEALEGLLAPSDAAARVEEIHRARPRFPWPLAIVGYTVLTLGLGLMQNPTWAAVPAYLGLGAFVGTLVLFGKWLPILRDVIPLVAAVSVTVIARTFLAEAVGDDVLRMITPPLASFLPGLVLTIAALELTNGEIVAGASRSIFGISQLMMLAFGVAVGFSLTSSVPASAPGAVVGEWAPLAGVLLIAIGYTFYSSAPKGAFIWIVVMLAAVWGAQRVGDLFIDSRLTGFVGALVAVPLARSLAKLRSAPSASVLVLPAFWMLVPGALGLIGISETAIDGVEGLESLVTTGLALFSISLGILVGTSLVREYGRARSAWDQSA